MDMQARRGSGFERQRQRALLGQALAVATIANDVGDVRGDWWVLASGLERAMHGWHGRASLGALGQIGPRDLERVIGDCSARPGHLAAWTVGASLTPSIVLDLWSPAEVLDRLGSQVPLRSWRARGPLARGVAACVSAPSRALLSAGGHSSPSART